MGITGNVTKLLIQSPSTGYRSPPSLIETQAVLLLKVMANNNPKHHLFFNELINAGGIPIFLDYIDRQHHQTPQKILISVIQILCKL